MTMGRMGLRFPLGSILKEDDGDGDSYAAEVVGYCKSMGGKPMVKVKAITGWLAGLDAGHYTRATYDLILIEEGE